MRAIDHYQLLVTPKMKLSDAKCRTAPIREKQYRLTDGAGLSLLVRPSGAKLWQYRYKIDGKYKTVSYGQYPYVSLKQARELHLADRSLWQQGICPMEHRKEQAQAVKATFRHVAEEWRAHWKVGKTEKHDRDVWRRLEIDVFPEIGDMPVAEITTAHVRDCVKKIEARGAVDMARRQLQKCNQIMRYAVAHDYIERNPVAEVRPGDILPARKKRNYARIDVKDLPQLLYDIDNYTGSAHTRLAMKLMALTFVRTSELIGATWDEFDGDFWRISAERMKMPSEHIVPLSTQTKEVLKEIKALSFGRDYLFPHDLDKPTHMSNNTILYALYRMGYRGRMTGHGFRGVASTILHEEGWPHEHIELQLAHQERDETSAAYNYALYLPQRAEMMQWWGDYLEKALHTHQIAVDKNN